MRQIRGGGWGGGGWGGGGGGGGGLALEGGKRLKGVSAT